MADDNEALKHVHAALGYEHVSRAWARLEIFFGLAASGLGMLVGLWAVSHPAMQLGWAGAGLLLFMFGGYLALAGHRSLVYQSMNRATALLLDRLARMEKPGLKSNSE